VADETQDEILFNELGANGYNGLEYKEQEQSWYWGTVAATYENWGTDQPSNGTDKECAVYDATSTWGHVVCTSE